MKLSSTKTTPSLIKAFLIGSQGTGKSGSLVPLAIKGEIKGCPVHAEGFAFCVLDFDGKFEEMAYAVLDELLHAGKITADQRAEALARIDIRVCRENMGVVQIMDGKKVISKYGVQGTTTAWKNGVTQLGKWLPTFTANHVLILDSLTHAAKAAMNFQMELNGLLNQSPTGKQHMAPQQSIAELMTIMADVKCHSVVNAHWRVEEIYQKFPDTLDKDGNPEEKLLDMFLIPVSVGRAGAMELPSQFNHCLVTGQEGEGSQARRYIHTRPYRGIETKSPFFSAKPRYDISTGMVEYFALRG